MTDTMPQALTGLSDIADRYDLFICDLWGVLHNGEQPYPHVLDCLDHLHAAGKTIVFLSNAPRPNETVLPKLTELGFDLEKITAVVTSGDATVKRLASGQDGSSPFHIGPERDKTLFVASGLPEALEDEADFVLCSGLYDDETETPEDYADLLSRLLDRGLSMVCANPDIRVIRGNGYIYCGGAIARAYEDRGGLVHYCGKPDASIFSYTLQQVNGKAARSLMIGDGAFTDILGANRAGLDSLFIAGGLHRDVLGLDDRRTGSDLHHSVASFLSENHVTATAWLEGLGW